MYEDIFMRFKAFAGTSRKAFAEQALQMSHPDIYFKMLDGKRADIAIVDKIKKSMKKLDKVRDLIGTEFKTNE